MYVRFVATGRRRPRELPCTAACLVDYAVYLHCCVWAHVNIAVVWRGGGIEAPQTVNDILAHELTRIVRLERA